MHARTPTQARNFYIPHQSPTHSHVPGAAVHTVTPPPPAAAPPAPGAPSALPQTPDSCTPAPRHCCCHCRRHHPPWLAHLSRHSTWGAPPSPTEWRRPVAAAAAAAQGSGMRGVRTHCWGLRSTWSAPGVAVGGGPCEGWCCEAGRVPRHYHCSAFPTCVDFGVRVQPKSRHPNPCMDHLKFKIVQLVLGCCQNPGIALYGCSGMLTVGG